MLATQAHPLRAVLFDLDGTLIDHFRVIYRCYCYALEQMGMEPVDFATVKRTVGGSVPITMAKLVGEARAPEAVTYFKAHYEEIWHEEIDVLDGAGWILSGLRARGLRTGVFTNKGGGASRAIAERTGLAASVDAVVGTGDTPYRKPEPEFAHYALRQVGARAEEACLVGDSPYDIAAAAAVGMTCYTVGTGTHTVAELAETPHGGAYPDLYSLGQEVFGLAPPRGVPAGADAVLEPGSAAGSMPGSTAGEGA